jgi:hypothetical protein
MREGIHLFCSSLSRSTASRPVSSDIRPPYWTCDQLFFLLYIKYFHTFAVYSCWAPSLTRGRVCNLLVQLLLSLDSAVTLGSKSWRAGGLIFLSNLRLIFPFCRLLTPRRLQWMYSIPQPCLLPPL